MVCLRPQRQRQARENQSECIMWEGQEVDCLCCRDRSGPIVVAIQREGKYQGRNSTLSDDGTKDDWLRHGQAAVQQRTIRLFGGNEEYYRRD